MKKLIISLAGGMLLTGFAMTTAVSAEADYKIQEGDTVSEVAVEYGTTTKDLMERNNLSSSLIVAGESLKIDNRRVLEVKKGDTLSELACDLGVKVGDIKEWNELDSDLIKIGQELELELPLDSLKNYEEFLAQRDGQVPPKEEPKQEENIEQTANEQTSKEETKQEENVEQTSNEQTSTQEQEVEQTNNTEEAAQTMTMEATAYTADCEGCSGVTSTGINLNEDRDKKVVAVDPDVIPLGSTVWVEGYGEAIAGDTGGSIEGNRIDVHVPTKEEANEWGVRTVEVKVVD
ncbi:LysM peptidoglycan-binding domain-containing protein [Piscibacillus halophilus]|uniref:LysM peptidoglycan-binding domain-containing protein n=1 Tax=Piscibacillus halophilus TaxID=571933 RepID=UPI00158B28E4|nr:3D domain-containing protein [Piscibacillus halophilus]